MKPIVYNLTNIRPPLTGIGRYAYELIREMYSCRPSIAAVKHGKVYQGARLKTLLDQLDTNLDQSFSNTRHRSIINRYLVKVPFSRSLYRGLDNYLFWQTRDRLATPGAVAHDLNYSLEPHRDSLVTTVYDLSNLVCPDTHPNHRVRYLNSYFKKLCSSESKIVTISNTVKSELIDFYGISEHRIIVTHLAADKCFFPKPEQECLITLNKYGLRFKQFVLCVGTLEPRKNLSTVLSAYESLDQHTQSKFPLVLVGPPGWKNSKLAKRINKLKSHGRVRQLGFVSQKELPDFYASAAVFVYPSLYEGFGLPLLEAMQSGCPCITSNSGALAEVSDLSAVQVNPLDSDEIAEELLKLLHDNDHRARYKKLGLHRAGDFSWAKTASKTSKLYDSI